MTQALKLAKSAKVHISVPIPLGAGLDAEVDFLTFEGLEDGKEHIAIGFGDWRSQAEPLVRLHSECLTGDVFGSLRCDCGPQLKSSMQLFAKEGGLLLYLRQEGRGIGLYKKLEAYGLQLEGMDTFEANRALGSRDDLRDFSCGAAMLSALGKHSIRLVTNNPDKFKQLEAYGISVVERISTGVFMNAHNVRYLVAKKRKHHHDLDFDGDEVTP